MRITQEISLQEIPRCRCLATRTESSGELNMLIQVKNIHSQRIASQRSCRIHSVDMQEDVWMSGKTHHGRTALFQSRVLLQWMRGGNRRLQQRAAVLPMPPATRTSFQQRKREGQVLQVDVRRMRVDVHTAFLPKKPALPAPRVARPRMKVDAHIGSPRRRPQPRVVKVGRAGIGVGR